jgi:hypothetical protein
MHVLFDLTTKTIAEYLRTYVVSFSVIIHTLSDPGPPGWARYEV